MIILHHFAVISKDPDDPNKTRITMLSHANPGGGLPQWVSFICYRTHSCCSGLCLIPSLSSLLLLWFLKAMNTAVNAVVQIEPFKFFHNINDSICNYQETSSSKPSQTVDVVRPGGRSNKPAGIAHLGELVCGLKSVHCFYTTNLLWHCAFVIFCYTSGFTCFWPNGGGLKEDSAFASQQDMWSDDDEEDDDSDDEYADWWHVD